MIRLFLIVLTVALTWAPAAEAAPVFAFVATAVASFAGPAGLGLSIGAALSVGSFVVQAAAVAGLSAISKVLTRKGAAKATAASVEERQASATTLTLGEGPRRFLFGHFGDAGTLIGAGNYGGAYGTDWEVLAIRFCDHAIDALEGVYISDLYVPFTGNGAVAGYNGQLFIYFFNAPPTGWAPPSDLYGIGPCFQANANKGVCGVVVGYKIDPPDASAPIWAGRPSFVWKGRGKRLYEPRLDSTAPGGSGAHRWTDPATWHFTTSLQTVRYNWVRGIYAFDDVTNPEGLLIGRGLSALEAPPEAIFAAANLCDEVVDDGFGGLENRYVAHGLILADEPFDVVEARFAAACAGEVVQPQGSIAVQPGAAKTAAATISLDNLVTGTDQDFQWIASDNERVNTIIPRYVEPAQKWAATAAPISRDSSSVALFGSREMQLSLDYVQSRGQAMRIAEIRLKQRSYQRVAKITLPPEYAGIEENDWINANFGAFTDNTTKTFQVVSFQLDEAWRNTLVLKETSAAIYGGVALLDSINGPAPLPPPDALALAGATGEIINIDGGSGVTPALRAFWTTPVDPAITRIRCEVREFGQTQIAAMIHEGINDGVLITTNGIGSARDIQFRLTPLGAPFRPVIPSSWTTLTVVATQSTVTDAIQADIDAALADAAAAAADASTAVAQVLNLSSYRPNILKYADMATVLADYSIFDNLGGAGNWFVYDGDPNVGRAALVNGNGGGDRNAWLAYATETGFSAGQKLTVSSNPHLMSDGVGTFGGGNYRHQISWHSTAARIDGSPVVQQGTVHNGPFSWQSSPDSRRLAWADEFTCPSGKPYPVIYCLFSQLAGSGFYCGLQGSVKVEIGGLPATTLQNPGAASLQASINAGVSLGRLVSYLSLNTTVGGSTASVDLISTVTTSLVRMIAKYVSIGTTVNGVAKDVLTVSAGLVHLTEPLIIDIGGMRLALGPGLGTDGQLAIWWGPSSIDPGAMTRGNGTAVFALDGIYYLGRVLGRSIIAALNYPGTYTPLPTDGSWVVLADQALYAVPGGASWFVDGQVIFGTYGAVDGDPNTSFVELYTCDPDGSNVSSLYVFADTPLSSIQYLVKATLYDGRGGSERRLRCRARCQAGHTGQAGGVKFDFYLVT